MTRRYSISKGSPSTWELMTLGRPTSAGHGSAEGTWRWATTRNGERRRMAIEPNRAGFRDLRERHAKHQRHSPPRIAHASGTRRARPPVNGPARPASFLGCTGLASGKPYSAATTCSGMSRTRTDAHVRDVNVCGTRICGKPPKPCQPLSPLGRKARQYLRQKLRRALCVAEGKVTARSECGN